MVLKILLASVALILLVVVGLLYYGRRQMARVPGMSFEETIRFTTRGREGARITVGTLRQGEAAYTVYGAEGEVRPPEQHTYEIGSVTKTMTAALVSRAVREGRLDIGLPIDRYLSLPAGRRYPTVEELLTHTSGYRSYYFEAPMAANFFARRNSFYGISKEDIRRRVAETTLGDGPHAFSYSNFGYAVLGLVLEAVYGEDYTALLNRYLQQELGLRDTRIADGTGDLKHYWTSRADDGYIPAGMVTSNITDMLAYLRLQMGDDPDLRQTWRKLRSIHATSGMYEAMGIRLDDIGMAWIIDRESGLIWHNGGTGKYNSFVGFHPASQTGVVVLSNLSPGDRLPATVSGIKLLKALIE